VLVQPYLADIDEHGETGAVYAGNAFSHGFRKGPILVPGVGWVEGHYREEEIGPRDPDPAERAVAEAALDAIAALVPGHDRADLLYARVDMVPGPDGAPMVLELELVEPSLWTVAAPESPERIARAFVAALDG
jgi:hypothetical protein